MESQYGHGALVCAIPRDTDEFRRLHDLERSLFGDLALPLEVMSGIFAIRPETFNAVFAPNGTVVAYTSAFPLRPPWGAALIDGDLTESELRPEMIYRRGDCHTGTLIYVSAVAVDAKCDPILKSVLLGSLLWFRVHQLWSASVQCLSMVMTTVSREGERLARRLGATIARTAETGWTCSGCDLTPRLLGGVFGTMDVFPFGKSILMDFSVPSAVGG